MGLLGIAGDRVAKAYRDEVARGRRLGAEPRQQRELETTSSYVQVSIQEPKQLHGALHPAARLQPHHAAESADEGGNIATARERLDALDTEDDCDE